MGKSGLATMLHLILRAGAALAVVVRPEVDLAEVDHAEVGHAEVGHAEVGHAEVGHEDSEFDLDDDWWELSGERPPALPS